ncbi:hypothetical protein [Streptosporangium sp. NPDC000396]|uniref:hypothetical protein n=1 Tax=Streptosporangium sp. NPDC000396 TaxID=3366185 RepID=UPI003676E647
MIKIRYALATGAVAVSALVVPVTMSAQPAGATSARSADAGITSVFMVAANSGRQYADPDDGDDDGPYDD